MGGVSHFGDAPTTKATDIELTPSGRGYWVVNAKGQVYSFGDANYLGNANRSLFVPGEIVTAMSSTPTGRGLLALHVEGPSVPVRRRALPRRHAAHTPCGADRRVSCDNRPGADTSWRRPTAACSRSATRTSRARGAAPTCGRRSSPSSRPEQLRILARSRPTATSSRSTPPSSAPTPRPGSRSSAPDRDGESYRVESRRRVLNSRPSIPSSAPSGRTCTRSDPIVNMTAIG